MSMTYNQLKKTLANLTPAQLKQPVCIYVGDKFTNIYNVVDGTSFDDCDTVKPTDIIIVAVD